MTTCSYCGGKYEWTVTPEGNRPINQDGEGLPHWRTCRGFRKASRNRGKRFKRAAQRTVTPAVPKLTGITGQPVAPTCAGCTATPWEPCPCSEKRKQNMSVASESQNATLDLIDADQQLNKRLELAGQV